MYICMLYMFYMSASTCVWSPKVDSGCCTLSLFTLNIVRISYLNPDIAVAARVFTLLAFEILPLLLECREYSWVGLLGPPGVYMDAVDWNSGPHVSVESALLSCLHKPPVVLN